MVMLLLVASNTFLFAEGSINFRNYPGHRLFYNVEQNQQLKVYASDGEFINVGSSHVGINGGTIEVYNPSGQLVATFDGSGNTAIIFNDVEELNGPTGGAGYNPGVVAVPTGQGGVWSIRLRYPEPQRQRFTSSLLNSDPWTRAANQPNTNIFDQRVALAWDITVTQGGAGNAGGTAVSGRLYSKEYISILDGNGRSTSPTFYILTRAGYVYQINFNDTDPWGFPIHSNSFGLVKGDSTPTYMSGLLGGDVLSAAGSYIRSDDPASWDPLGTYLFEPQAEGVGSLINNKIFFNTPDPNLPTSATVTNLERANTHTTWLLNEMPIVDDTSPFTFRGILPANGICEGELVAEQGAGGNFIFGSELSGQAVLRIDINNNGSFADLVDVTLTKIVGLGQDSIFWDGSDGEGTVIPANPNFNFAYDLTIRGGEMHLLLADIENNSGGVTFTRTNGPDSPDSTFYYDHTGIGAQASGNGTAGNPLPTTNPFTYSDGFGNQKMLDQWAFIETNNFGTGTLAINIVADCNPPTGDHDNDGIPDLVDIDDDNDGIPDLLEFCHPEEGFACLPGGLDPSSDEDGDGIQNYQDANDAAVNSGCIDANADGICDQIIGAYDTDGDNVPDHYDLDSDNDGISDLVEAGHNQADTDGNGVIDGDPSVFGANGLFSALETNDSPTGVANYVPWDFDGDRIPDHDDLDSDNDGILDVVEAGYASSDTNQDGRIDSSVNSDGLVELIDPAITGQGIPLPIDWDGDGVPDWHDLDSDQDGILDVVEAGYANSDTNQDGRIDDGNGNVPTVNVDGLPPVMNPNGTGQGIPLPIDWDSDGVPDWHDLDSDQDGILDVIEAGYIDSDSNQDGRIDDGNGNIPAVDANGIAPVININGTGQGIPLPIDWDSDGVPDWHDLDSDNDGILDVIEGGYQGSDTNLDGRIDDGNGNIPTVNADGLPPVMTTGGPINLPPDTDGDLVRDWHDLDADNDGINDTVENINPDGDGDGFIGTGPITVDANGIATADANGPVVPNTPLVNTDGEGPGDFRDLDADGDGINDVIEGGLADLDGDGIIGTGIPTVNPFGQSTDGTTSNPTDTDGDGTPDFQQVDEACDAPATPILAVSATALCEGESLTLSTTAVTGTNISYTWTAVGATGTAEFITNVPTFSLDALTVANSGGYTLIVTSDTCVSAISNQIDIVVSPRPTAPVLTANESVVCEGASITLNAGAATANTTYEWTLTTIDGNATVVATTNESTLVLDAIATNQAGTYTVVAAGGDGACPSGPSNGVDIAVSPNPATPVLSSSAASACEGDPITLSATGTSDANTTYEWTLTTADGTATVVSTTNEPTLTLDAISADQAGTYTVAAIGGGGACPSDASNGVDISVTPRPTAPVLTADESVVCEGTSVTLNAGDTTANTTYEWTLTMADGSATVAGITNEPTLVLDAITTNQAGTYTVVAAGDGGACPSDPSNGVDIAVSPKPDAPVLSSSAASACEGDPITLSATGAVDANTTYEWTLTTADGTATVVATTNAPTLTLDAVSADQAGTYTVETIGGGGACPSGPSNGVDISVSPRPDAPELTVDKDTHCEGDRLEFMATPIAGATYTWTFTNPEGRVDFLAEGTRPSLVIENLVFTNTGNYQVVITLDGCPSLPSNDVAIDVASGGLPDVTATSSAPVENPACEGTNVTLSVDELDGFTYEWSGPNGVVGTTAETIIVGATPDDNGEYSVTITNPSGCPNTVGPVTVQVDPKPATPTISADQTTVCPGEGFTLSTDAVVGDNITYEWFLNGTSVGTTDDPALIIIGAQTADGGNYTVTVNNGGCPSDPSDPIEITVQPPVEGDITMEPAGGVCEGETVTLTAPSAEGATYEWTGPNGFSSTDATVTLENVTADNNGDYSVVVTLNGCPTDFGPTTLEINPKPATPTANTDKDSACPGEAVTLSTMEATGDAISYDWLLNGEVVANTAEPTLLIEDFQEGNAGDYTVVVKDGSCPSDPSDSVSVILKENLEGVSAASNSPVCIGDPINLMVTDVEGATFEWTGPNGYTSTEQNPVIDPATEADAGEYTVTVTIDGCPATIPPTTVEVTPKPDAPTVSISEGPICEGTAATITVADPQANTTYTVLDAAGNTVASGMEGAIEVPTDGAVGDNTYTVIAQEDGGCPSEPSNAVDLTVTPRPEEEAMILTELMQDDCGGMIPTSLEAAVPTEGTGMWTSSNADVVFTDAASPVIDVMGLEDGDMITWTLSNETCGEYSTASLTISIPMPPMTTATDDAFTILNSETVTGNVTGNDTPNDGTVTVIAGPASGTGNIDANGNITYTPNDGFVGNDQFIYELCNTDCPDAPCDQATVNITVNQDPSNLDCMVPDVISPNGDGLNDLFKIECADFKSVNLKIFNRWGDLVFEADNYNNDWGGEHDGADLPPGPYYYIFEETGPADNPEPTTGCVSIAR